MIKKASLKFAVVLAAVSAGIVNVSATETEPVGVSVKGALFVPTNEEGQKVDSKDSSKKESTWNFGAGFEYNFYNMALDESSTTRAEAGVEVGGYMGDNSVGFGGVSGGVRVNDMFYAKLTAAGFYASIKDEKDGKYGFMVKPTVGADVYNFGGSSVFVEGHYDHFFGDDSKKLSQFGVAVGVRF